MNILMLSTDRAVFDEESPVRRRLTEQAALVSSMHVIVLSKKSDQFEAKHFGRRLAVYPTGSSGRLAYLSDAYRLGKKILRAGRPLKHWVITTQDPFELGAVGYLLALFFRTAFHVQLHTDPWSVAWRGGSPWNRFRFFLGLFILRRADSVRVVSSRVGEKVLALGVPRDRMTTIPIFVDTEHFFSAKPAFDPRRTYPAFSKIVLSIGRLEPEKNFHGLIRAFTKVHATFPDALLLIIGNGSERERLLTLARSLDLDHCVKILPWARDVATYYKTCDVYVQPSFYEGWGLAVIEALASGAPVVMTDVGCAGEVLEDEHSGLVVPAGDEDALAGALVRMLGNHTLAFSLAANGNLAVKKLATKAETLMLYKTSWEKAIHHASRRNNT